MHISSVNNRKSYLLGIVYIIIVKLLCCYCYPNRLVDVYSNMYGESSDLFVSIIGIVMGAIIGYVAISHHFDIEKISVSILSLIELFYFLPGIILLTSRGTEINYVLFFFSFWLVMVFWNKVISPEKGMIGSLVKGGRQSNGKRIILLLLIVLISIVSAYFSGASFSNLDLAIYDNRSMSGARGTHWIFTALAMMCAYAISILISELCSQRKYLIIPVLLTCTVYLYSIGSDRIYLFLSLIAIVFSITKANLPKLFKYVVYYVLVCLILYFILPILGDFLYGIYDRLGLIPVRVSVWYYDFIKINSPEYLQDSFTRLYNFFGVERLYPNSLSRAIGYYYTSNPAHNPNTGLVGGSLGNFGYISILISPLFYIIAFRLIGSVADKISNGPTRLTVALVFAIYAINANQFFAAMLHISALSLLLLFILVYFDETSKDY